MSENIYKIGNYVTVKCDDDKNMIGRLVGTATLVTTDESGWSDSGLLVQQYLVELRSKYRGVLCQQLTDAYGEPTELKQNYPCTISTIIVEPDNLDYAPVWVNVYEYDRGYGGPEEGGWWYDTFEDAKVSFKFTGEHAYEDAQIKRAELRDGEYPSTGKAGTHGSDREDWAVMVQFHPAESYDTNAPYC